jgi:hypothetical protein
MSEGAGQAFTLGPGGGRSIDLGGFSMLVKATGEDTDEAFSLLEAEPAGFGPPLMSTTTLPRRSTSSKASTSSS